MRVHNFEEPDNHCNWLVVEIILILIGTESSGLCK